MEPFEKEIQEMRAQLHQMRKEASDLEDRANKLWSAAMALDDKICDWQWDRIQSKAGVL